MASRKKKVAFGCLGVLALALALFVFSVRRFLFAPELDVVSIRTEATYQDPALLASAWALPVARAYEDGVVTFQPNGSICGPTSVANVLHSYGEKAATPATVLAGTGRCPLGFCMGGLTLDELAQVARKSTHRSVTVLRDLSLDDFRSHLARANDPTRRYIINFDRGPLFRKPGGHHSPLVGYLSERDLVLVLDVNETFKPWLVDADRLYQAMSTVDPGTSETRGLLLIE